MTTVKKVLEAVIVTKTHLRREMGMLMQSVFKFFFFFFWLLMYVFRSLKTQVV